MRAIWGVGLLMLMALILGGLGLPEMPMAQAQIKENERIKENEKVMLTVGGQSRFFLIHTPPQMKALSAPPLPVVLVLHGGGGGPEGMATMTGMNRTANQYGFIAVYPAGSSGMARDGVARGSRGDKLLTWNAGRCCGRSSAQNVDDVGFLFKVIDTVLTRYHADPKRVYVTGHSNGAMMSHRLACELSERIAAIAPVAGQPVLTTPCQPKRWVPTLHIHGTADECARYEGGNACGGCFSVFFQDLGLPLKAQTWPCAPVPQSIEALAKARGGKPSSTPYLQQGKVSCKQYAGGAAPVILCSVQGGGHTWPGSKVSEAPFCTKRPNGKLCQKWQANVGPLNQDIQANELMWHFFSKYHL